MPTPKSLTVQSKKYEIRVESVKKNLGHFSEERQLIRLSPKLQPDGMAETLLHETLHAAWAHTPLANGEVDEEVVVRSLSPILFDILRRNRAFTDYITGRNP